MHTRTTDPLPATLPAISAEEEQGLRDVLRTYVRGTADETVLVAVEDLFQQFRRDGLGAEWDRVYQDVVRETWSDN